MIFRNDKISCSIGFALLSIILLTVAFAATTGKNWIEQDCFMRYDLYVSGTAYKGLVTDSGTNFWYLVTETVPAASTNAAQDYCVKVNSTHAYLCITNNHFGAGTNWVRFGVTNTW